MAHSLQGVYAPLPQSLSDSDSEKEISMEPVCTGASNSAMKTSAKLENMSRLNGHFSFTSLNDDMVKIRKARPKMSTMRKAAFLFSILLCFLPIMIFLWILPCSESNTCPTSIFNWEYQQGNIELKGKINLVHGAFQNSLNLALMYKGGMDSQKVLKHGVISFLGSSGAVAWDFQQENEPMEMNCSIIDVNGNGFNDCLVIDKMGLKAIETITGEAVWHAHSAQEKSIPQLDMPVKVDDFDSDNVDELLSIYKKESFLLISGKTGLALSNMKLSTDCYTISNLTLVDLVVKYSCTVRRQPTRYFQIFVSDLKKKYHDSTEVINPQEVDKKLTDNNQVIHETGNCKLMIENLGPCPHCRSIVSLYRPNNNTKIKELRYDNAYVMTPISYTFKENSIVSLKGHVYGFILKIWEWKDSKKLPPTVRVYKRSLPANNKTYYLNEISEIGVLITFNETDTRIINASLVDRFQICTNTNNVSNCQPEYLTQRDSLLIADMDHDRSQELISYSSSYVRKEGVDGDGWHLVSFVKVLKLENELPKLYEYK
ncbi:hypothetical protein NQ315_000958 [Exocentrus adspersus]|uniref:FAM234A/B beta-propeller domain-containing protein n=1 Tax=Exocentrus adspersus TaxID=1586481 RepID=A0AAV8WDV5_9CUCU|nr:hypothetical protein NQ315_000958 [Exocentrus adspersus]